MAGLQARRISLLWVLFVSQLIGLLCLLPVLVIDGSSPPALVRLLPAAAGGVAGLAALAAFYKGLAIGTMSIVAPISATGVAVPVVIGLLSGDRPKALALIGIFFSVLGVVLASREQSHEPAERRLARISLGLALIAALGFGSFFVGMRVSAKANLLWALLAARVLDMVVLTVAVSLRGSRARGDSSPQVLVALAAVGILDLLANGFYALATRHGLLSVVAVASSLYPLGTILLARAVLGERVRRIQELGIAAAVAGVALIAAA